MERYRSQIGASRLPQAYGQNFVDGAATGVQVAGAWGRLGETIQKAGEVMKRRQDEWDATRAMEANNELVKRMTSYMEDPDTGVLNTRKLGLARGLTQQADADTDRFIAEIDGQLDNDAQKQAFRAMAERSRVPFWKQASHFEAAQVNEYRGQVFKNTLDAGMQMTLRDPMDEGAFEAASVQGATAIRAQYVGADEKVVKAAVDEYVSGLEAARISAVSEGNPLLGEALIKSSPYLTPMDARKLRGTIAPKAEIYRRQEAVDDLVQRFGPGQEQEGLAWIREHKGGEEEERLASAYKQRIGEMTVREVNADAELRKQQEANFTQMYKDAKIRGDIPTREELNAAFDNNLISRAHYNQGLALLDVAVTRADVTKKLSKSPDWSSLTPQQQEERIMRGMGVTQEDREAALAAIQAGVLDGTMTDAELSAYHKSGRITSAELERFKGMDNKLTGEQKGFVGVQRKMLDADIAKVDIPGGNGAGYKTFAQAKFNELVSQLDPNGKTYRMDVMNARRDALSLTVQESGKKQTRVTWFGFGSEEPTPFGVRVNKALDELNQEAESVTEYSQDLTTDDIHLENRPTAETERAAPLPRPAGNTGNIGLDMVGGSGRITGRFSDARAYRKGKHNGIDVAVPEGTPIVSPDAGVPLTVTRVVTGSPSKGGGNTVTLSGTLPDGRAVSLTASHMQNGSIALKPGDVVQPGEVIGRVGNTGMTSDRQKGGITAWYPGKKSGYHLDLKIKVNGEYVDPEAFSFGAGKKPAAPPKAAAPKQAAAPGPAPVPSPTPEPPASRPGPTIENARKLEGQTAAPQQKRRLEDIFGGMMH